uniref:Cellulase n=1 Tax=uncultured symbiotic protist of Hodotermopsis sjoestedti TaxID=403659 RepID=A4UWU8_9EUKA|nr:putative glycosyl hydrolase family45 [uncultured symbiotic protist of Hodotermopsis sjoestedti]BAF57360.1 putative glycosyl hydrolase family45 [uncultured symbiotic protist of Hodotermopsis sjoestedti]
MFFIWCLAFSNFANLSNIQVKRIKGGASGSGTTTRYWDCCKPSCSWTKKAAVSSPVKSCGTDGSTASTTDEKSGCDGGTSYMCANQIPRAVNDSYALGFAAASISGYDESKSCCACMELTFTGGAVSGKKMVVQVTNTGGDLGSNQFDLAIPGGGVGIYNGCTSQYGAPSDGWGSRYGGVASASDCSQLPSALQSDCRFRFDWFGGSGNPSISFNEVSCPSELTGITGCVRN